MPPTDDDVTAYVFKRYGSDCPDCIESYAGLSDFLRGVANQYPAVLGRVVYNDQPGVHLETTLSNAAIRMRSEATRHLQLPAVAPYDWVETAMYWPEPDFGVGGCVSFGEH